MFCAFSQYFLHGSFWHNMTQMGWHAVKSTNQSIKSIDQSTMFWRAKTNKQRTTFFSTMCFMSSMCDLLWDVPLTILLKRVHKYHNELTAPMGVVCFYARPIEHLVSNIQPEFAGPLPPRLTLFSGFLRLSEIILGTTFPTWRHHFSMIPTTKSNYDSDSTICYSFI